ncbi:hypothetical protein KR009_004825 [Drosophila setifemur]|nr:hypothetical protein KR009_004825 [Drosophila setifemur]
MRIDLKALLLISMSTTPDQVIHLRKRIQCRNVSFLLSYELQRGHLLIRQLKRIRSSSSLRTRLKRRRRRLQRWLELGIGLPKPRLDRSCQTSETQKTVAVETQVVYQESIEEVPYYISVDVATETEIPNCNTVAVDTEDMISDLNSVGVATEDVEITNTASQTVPPDLSSCQVDTWDLVVTVAKEQQTHNPVSHSSGCQTELNSKQSRHIQVAVKAKSSTTQTKLCNSSLATQTEVFCYANCSVQTEVDCQDGIVQTVDDEEDLMKPHLQALYLIYESIKNQSDIIHNGVLEAVNQLLEVSVIEMKARHSEQDRPREASFKPPQLGLDHIGDTLKPEKVCSEEELKKLFSRLELKLDLNRSNKGRRHSVGHFWYSKRRCKPCDLHMQRTRNRMTIQGTQTEVVEEEVEEKVVAVVSSKEIATQTEKERGRWTLKRH